MAVLAFAQIGLGSMLLGIYLDLPWFEYKVGSNPFILMRQDAPESDLPERQLYAVQAGFVDGNGLNVLLKNYWMVIHPPVLFLGFASVIVPFAYAVGALWTRDYGGWVKTRFTLGAVLPP